jgi:ATP-dependent DNA helicase DinG
MHGELVAIDLETTGLDPFKDTIIEVGAIRMRDGKIVEEFSTLVDPDRPIPTLITSITGIRNEDIIGAPHIQKVVPQIRAFVGDAILIGHNIGFDTSFLYRQGILQTNPRVDTYDLASVMLPRAPRYSLSSLAEQINIDLENAHRALDDARATALLYWLLWNKIRELPIATLYEINLASADLAWDSRIVFDAALRERIAQGEQPSASDMSIASMFSPARPDAKALRPKDAVEPLDSEAVTHLVEQDGVLAEALPGYEYRPQQVEMTRAIVDGFNNSDHIMIEAGTGTGKSIAYLVPAIAWATQNNERVVISTNTINLQEQLLDKDIPALQEALGIPFTATVLKGRGNYLCPRRLIAVRRRRPTSVDELRTLAKILVWMLESNTGDKGEISLRGPVENITWQRLSAEDEGCTLERCNVAMEGACPFYKARKAAEAAHLVIVNHALLVADAMSDNRVLPDYRYLVIDEAHHLEEATTNGLSFRLDESTLRRRLADLGGPRRGLLGSLLNSAQTGASEKDIAKLELFVETISEATSAMEVHIGNLFNAVRAFVLDVTGKKMNDYNTQIRITEDLRSRMSFNTIQTKWLPLREFFETISMAMGMVTTALNRMKTANIADFDDLINSTATAARYLEEVALQLNAVTTNPDSNAIYWINVSQDSENLSIHSAPLHVGPLVEKYLWSTKESIVMTSATLQTNRSFDYIRERLHGEAVKALEVGSPFNYKENTLIYVPNDMPDPNDRHRYQQAVERGLIELAAALNGRVLGLFTSYTQLRETAQAITPRLALGNIVVYDQSDGSSRQALLDGFKSSERAVLLGTRSFWEGVDIPGESLSALVIVRLPFAVPSDPVFAARSETYGNSFSEYALPDAILRFRQGFGRLIRTTTDRGIVTIFDSRVSSKSYGASFIEALPDCTIEYGPLQALPDAAKLWLSRGSV